LLSQSHTLPIGRRVPAQGLAEEVSDDGRIAATLVVHQIDKQAPLEDADPVVVGVAAVSPPGAVINFSSGGLAEMTTERAALVLFVLVGGHRDSVEASR